MRPIRFRLTAPNWERPSPDYGSHIIMSITGITFKYIYIYIFHIHHLQVLSSIPGARDNIFHISYNTVSLLTYTSALFGSLAPTELLAAGSSWPRTHSPRQNCTHRPRQDCFNINFRRRLIRRRQSPAHQCACLTARIPNIDLRSSVREQQLLTSTIPSGNITNIHQMLHIPYQMKQYKLERANKLRHTKNTSIFHV